MPLMASISQVELSCQCIYYST